MSHILEIQSSAQKTGSVTRELSAQLVEGLRAQTGAAHTMRDVADGLPFVDEAWVGANFTDEAERTDDQRAALAVSDELIAELKEADTMVFGLPIYNFGVPAVLKAWVDQVARARVTFQFTEEGPVGLLEGKKAYLVIASGGTEAGSDIDFAVRYMQHTLGFIGIHDVTLVRADRAFVVGPEGAKENGVNDINAILEAGAAKAA